MARAAPLDLRSIKQSHCPVWAAIPPHPPVVDQAVEHLWPMQPLLGAEAVLLHRTRLQELGVEGQLGGSLAQPCVHQGRAGRLQGRGLRGGGEEGGGEGEQGIGFQGLGR